MVELKRQNPELSFQIDKANAGPSRLSELNNMLSFQKTYPTAELIVLTDEAIFWSAVSRTCCTTALALLSDEARSEAADTTASAADDDVGESA